MTRRPVDPNEAALARLLPPEATGPAAQNPSPWAGGGQREEERVAALADQITRVYLNSLPSNYVSSVGGPNYVQAWRGAARELARIQVAAVDAYEDNDFRFTRTEALHQLLATLVFPSGDGPALNGDLTQREFLGRMVGLLLSGARRSTLVGGLDALSSSTEWTLTPTADQFVFEVDAARTPLTAAAGAEELSHHHRVQLNSAGDGATLEAVYGAGVTGPAHTHPVTGFAVTGVEGDGLPYHTHELRSAWPELPLELERAARMVLRALGPARALYRYRNLFRDALRVWSEEVSDWSLEAHHYEDFRRDWAALAPYEAASGAFVSRELFTDPGADFSSVRVGAELVVRRTDPLPSTPRELRYRVESVQAFPYGDDPVARPYTTAPTGLSGMVRVVNGALVTETGDWAAAAPHEQISITAGPNEGVYRLGVLLGPGGGPAWESPPGACSAAFPLPSWLRVSPRSAGADAGLSYRVERDPGGARLPAAVTQDVSDQAIGSGSLVEIQLNYGPLVCPRGSLRPATRADVVVRYDGDPLEVAGVDPYTGVVTLADPLPQWPAPGDHTLTVSYTWYEGARFGLRLGRAGLTLGWRAERRGRGVSSDGVGPAVGSVGVRSRWRTGATLGVRYPVRSAPLRVAHRFIAFDRVSTAALGDPASLRLGAVPGRAGVPYGRVPVTPVEIGWSTGDGDPSAPWVSYGGASGSFDPGDGLYWGVPEEGWGYWGAEFPLTAGEAAVSVAARFTVDRTAAAAAGVWSGVGFGYSDSRRLYLAAPLLVPNAVDTDAPALRHLGVLKNGRDPTLLSSWNVGPYALGRVEPRRWDTGEAVVVTFEPGTVPGGLAVTDRFQVTDGPQTGVYRVVDLYHGPEGRTVVVVEPPFPGDPGVAGNREVTAYFELDWGAGPTSWRLHVEPRTSTVTVHYGGGVGARTAFFTSRLSTSEALAPDVLAVRPGRAFFGAVGRRGGGRVAGWQLFRAAASYEHVPGRRGTDLLTGDGEDPVAGGWYPVGPWGVAGEAAGTWRVSSLAAAASLATRYGYHHEDPLLTGRYPAALEARVTVEEALTGAAAVLELADPVRVARVAALRYYEPEPGVRALYEPSAVTLVGAVEPAAQGWEPGESGGTPEVTPEGALLRVRGGTAAWLIRREALAMTGGARLVLKVGFVSASTGDAGRPGLFVSVIIDGRIVTLEWRTGAVVLASTPAGFPLVTVPFDPYDGEDHHYEVAHHALSGLVTLAVDFGPPASTPLGGFPLSLEGPNVTLGVQPDPEPGSFEARVGALVWVASDESVPTLGRAWGLYRGGPPSDINSWALPRSDSSSAPNSDAAAAVVLDWDWRVEGWVRLLVVPRWGAVLIRPDLAPPPGYVGAWATESLDPSSGWVRLEYSALPRRAVTAAPGGAAWGGVTAGAAGTATYRGVRYRLFTVAGADARAPGRMTLGRYGVVTSAEPRADTTPETVVIASWGRTRVGLRAAHITATRVWWVRVGGVPLPETAWTFDPALQLITLAAPLPAESYPVEVTFAPGPPYTKTYLAAQPFEGTPRRETLGEGTPPWVASQTGSYSWDVVSGSGGPPPAFPPAGPGDPDYFLEDPYLVRVPVAGAARYNRVDLFSRTNGGTTGKVALFEDGSGPLALALSGPHYSERWPGAAPADPALTAVRGAPLTASGGAAGARSRLGVARAAASGPGSVRRERITWEIGLARRDEVWPGLSSGTGSVSYRVEYVAVYSRLGPWGGLTSLEEGGRLAGTSAAAPEGIPPGGAFTLMGGGALPRPAAPLVGTL